MDSDEHQGGLSESHYRVTGLDNFQHQVAYGAYVYDIFSSMNPTARTSRNISMANLQSF